MSKFKHQESVTEKATRRCSYYIWLFCVNPKIPTPLGKWITESGPFPGVDFIPFVQGTHWTALSACLAHWHVLFTVWTHSSFCIYIVRWTFIIISKSNGVRIYFKNLLIFSLEKKTGTGMLYPHKLSYIKHG